MIRRLRKFGLSEAELEERGANAAALCYTRLPLCSFCSQFFDPDHEDGLAIATDPNRDTTVYEPFFDGAYPETYTSRGLGGASDRPGSLPS